MRKRIKTALICFSVGWCMAGTLNAKNASTVFEDVSSSIVVIQTYDDQGKPKELGGGVVISRGIVATNHHVIDAAKKITVKHKGKETVGCAVRTAGKVVDNGAYGAPCYLIERSVL